MTPSMNQRLAELKMQQLHAEAAHARLVREARTARRLERGPSRFARMLDGVRGRRTEAQPAPADTAQRVAVRRTAARPVGC